MHVYNHHAPCINIGQCSCIKLPLEKHILTLTISQPGANVSQSSSFKSDKLRVVTSSLPSSSKSRDVTSLHRIATAGPPHNHRSNQTATPPRTIADDAAPLLLLTHMLDIATTPPLSCMPHRTSYLVGKRRNKSQVLLQTIVGRRMRATATSMETDRTPCEPRFTSYTT